MPNNMIFLAVEFSLTKCTFSMPVSFWKWLIIPLVYVNSFIAMLNARDSIRAKNDDGNHDISISLTPVRSFRSISSPGGRIDSDVSYIAIIFFWCLNARLLETTHNSYNSCYSDRRVSRRGHESGSEPSFPYHKNTQPPASNRCIYSMRLQDQPSIGPIQTRATGIMYNLQIRRSLYPAYITPRGATWNFFSAVNDLVLLKKIKTEFFRLIKEHIFAKSTNEQLQIL